MTAPHHLSFEERGASFWKQIEDKYGSLKGFDNFVFKSYRTKSVVRCSVHGDFETNPHQLLSDKKNTLCRKCSYEQLGKDAAARDFEARKEAFKQRVVEKLGSYAGFEDFKFVNYNTKSTVHCSKHGPYQKIASHLFGTDRNPCVTCQKEIDADASMKKFNDKMRTEFGDGLEFPTLTYTAISKNQTLTVECKEHGPFRRTPSNLLMGMGCNECQGRIPTAYTPESFRRKVANVRGTDEGLAPTVYTAHNKNVLIDCAKHGVVPIYPSTLLNGGWCEQCSIAARTKWNTELLIQASKEKFPGRLTYEDTVYKHWAERVTFCCSVHGKFKSLLDTHLRSASGCPGCTVKGYSDFKAGHLYVLQNDELTKIGITNKTPEKRMKDINHQSGKNFKLVRNFYFIDGSVPRKLETWLLQLYRAGHQQPEEVFDGYTEAFYEVDIQELLTRIEAKIPEFSS